MRSGVRYRELVGVRRARLDRLLGDERNAVLIVRHLEPVEVHAGGFGKAVPHVDANPVAFAHPDLGAGELLVVYPRLHPFARRDFPLDFRAGEIVNLDPPVHPGRQQLIALALGPGRKCLHPRLVHGVHLHGFGLERGRDNRSGMPGRDGEGSQRASAAKCPAGGQGIEVFGGRHEGSHKRVSVNYRRNTLKRGEGAV